MQQIFVAALPKISLHLLIVYHIDMGMLECFLKQMQSKYFENKIFI